MNLPDFQAKFQATHKRRPMLTDVFTTGTNLIFGASGTGKTKSTISNLNRYNIEPILIDFDKNRFLDKVDFTHVDGYQFLDYLEEEFKKRKFNLKDHKDLFNRVEKLMINNFNHIDDDKCFLPEQLDEFIEAKKDTINHKVLNVLLSDIQEAKNEANDVSNLLPHNQTYIIDTYVKCREYQKNDINKFIKLIEYLENYIKSNVIIISHEMGERGKTSELPYEFANHLDGQVRLRRDVTKTKGEDNYLEIVKVRGYNGDAIVKNWER